MLGQYCDARFQTFSELSVFSSDRLEWPGSCASDACIRRHKAVGCWQSSRHRCFCLSTPATAVNTLLSLLLIFFALHKNCHHQSRWFTDTLNHRVTVSEEHVQKVADNRSAMIDMIGSSMTSGYFCLFFTQWSFTKHCFYWSDNRCSLHSFPPNCCSCVIRKHRWTKYSITVAADAAPLCTRTSKSMGAFHP